MSVAAFLAELRRRDIRVWADGERLRCDAPSGVLTPELREELRSRKQDLLEFLHAAQSLARQERAIVPLQPNGEGTAVFAIPGHNGDVFCFRALAQYLGEERPFYGLEPPGLDGFGEPLTRVEDLAAYFAAQITAFRPGLPCVIGGYCAGATLALELARQLRGRGVDVRYLALFGSPYPTWYRWPAQWRWRLRRQVARLVMHAKALAARAPTGWPAYLRARLADRRAREAAEAMPADDPVMVRRGLVERATLKAARAYAPSRLQVRAGLFQPWRDPVLEEGARQWRALVPGIEEHAGAPGSDGFNLLREPYVFTTAELLRRALAAAEAPADAANGMAPAVRTMAGRPGFAAP
ncbi:MAG: thioesterase domain-containing protein [Ignavibacteria bacterium]